VLWLGGVELSTQQQRFDTLLRQEVEDDGGIYGEGCARSDVNGAHEWRVADAHAHGVTDVRMIVGKDAADYVGPHTEEKKASSGREQKVTAYESDSACGVKVHVTAEKEKRENSGAGGLGDGLVNSRCNAVGSNPRANRALRGEVCGI
jgi:hypothetical protein